MNPRTYRLYSPECWAAWKRINYQRVLRDLMIATVAILIALLVRVASAEPTSQPVKHPWWYWFVPTYFGGGLVMNENPPGETHKPIGMGEG